MIADLESLSLHYLAKNYDSFVDNSKALALSPEGILKNLVELEILDRERRTTERRLKLSKIGRVSSMQDFDWDWPENLSKSEIDSIFSRDFLKSKKNLVLAGPQGTGKTMIARNLGIYAVTCGYTCYFTTALQLSLDLGSLDSIMAIKRKLDFYARQDLMIIDEIGYVSFNQKIADLIFQIVNLRYEKKPTVVTTNVAFKDWGTIFSGAACVAAMVDRLTHHVKIVKIKGDSYRLKESKESQGSNNANKRAKESSIPTGLRPQHAAGKLAGDLEAPRGPNKPRRGSTVNANRP